MGLEGLLSLDRSARGGVFYSVESPNGGFFYSVGVGPVSLVALGNLKGRLLNDFNGRLPTNGTR